MIRVESVNLPIGRLSSTSASTTTSTLNSTPSNWNRPPSSTEKVVVPIVLDRGLVTGTTNNSSRNSNIFFPNSKDRKIKYLKQNKNQTTIKKTTKSQSLGNSCNLDDIQRDNANKFVSSSSSTNMDQGSFVAGIRAEQSDENTLMVVQGGGGDRRTSGRSSTSSCTSTETNENEDRSKKKIKRPSCRKIKYIKKKKKTEETTTKEEDRSKVESKKKNKASRSSKVKCNNNNNSNNNNSINSCHGSMTTFIMEGKDSPKQHHLTNRIEEIEERLRQIEQEKAMELEMMHQQFQQGKIQLAKECDIAKKLQQQEEQEAEKVQEQMNNNNNIQIVHDLQTENRHLMEQIELLGNQIELEQMEHYSLQERWNTVENRFDSLAIWVESQQSVLNTIQRQESNCRQEYIPRHSLSLDQGTQYIQVERRIIQIYQQTIDKILNTIQAKTTTMKAKKKIKKEEEEKDQETTKETHNVKHDEYSELLKLIQITMLIE